MTPHRLAAATISVAALLAIAGFTALGAIFDYPRILKEPTADMLAAFHSREGAVVGWFVVLVIGAALLAPAAVLFGRIAGGATGRPIATASSTPAAAFDTSGAALDTQGAASDPPAAPVFDTPARRIMAAFDTPARRVNAAFGPPGPWITVVGVAAAVVQVVGLSRWIVLVPWINDTGVVERLHFWLGEIVGETIGYALTAAFTVLVTHFVVRTLAPAWLTALGHASAVLIASGVISTPVFAAINFAGYVAWCLWLLTVAVVLWRTGAPERVSPSL
ncbi:hypothetical protein [Actinoplanes sp. NPDC049265]|uniref:hypothetical protein n=1 Tax=Actinoplanes sp. NPDC049265 TaxID=3363902 RepID=UPI0037187A51